MRLLVKKVEFQAGFQIDGAMVSSASTSAKPDGPGAARLIQLEPDSRCLFILSFRGGQYVVPLDNVRVMVMDEVAVQHDQPPRQSDLLDLISSAADAPEE